MKLFTFVVVVLVFLLTAAANAQDTPTDGGCLADRIERPTPTRVCGWGSGPDTFRKVCVELSPMQKATRWNWLPASMIRSARVKRSGG